MRWQVEGVVPKLSGERFFVGDFLCNGGNGAWRWEFTPHFEIELPRSGVHVRELGRQRHVVDATVAAAQRAGDEYRRTAPKGLRQSGTVLRLNQELTEELELEGLRSPVRLSAAAALLHRELNAAEDDLARCELGLQLVATIGADARAERPRACTAPPASWRRLADEVRQILAVHYAEALTLERIAALCSASPFHVSRVFRAVTGTTLHRELTRLRLRVALYAVRECAGSLAQLSLDVGFSSHSHFTSAFRAEFGVAPSRLLDVCSVR